MEKPLRFDVADMTCGGCVRALRHALDELPGVAVDHVAVGEPVAVRYDDAQTGPEAILDAVASAGYHPVPVPAA